MKVIAELISNVSILSIVFFTVGIILLIVEMHMPGFGAFGILGFISLVACIFVTADTVAQGLIMTAAMFVIVIIVLAVFASLASKGYLPKGITLKDATSSEQGFSGTEDMKYLIGKTGVAVTNLRPVGDADFDGVMLDVVSRGEFIEKGSAVEVIEVEGNRIVVRVNNREC